MNLSGYSGIALISIIFGVLVQFPLYKGVVLSEEAEEMKKREDPTYSEEDKEKKEIELLFKKTGCMVLMTVILWGHYAFTNDLPGSFGIWALGICAAITIVTIIAAANTIFTAFALGGSAKIGAASIMSSQGLDKFNTICVIISIIMVCWTIGCDLTTEESMGAINKKAQPAVAQPAIAQPAVVQPVARMFGKKLLNFGKRKLK